MTETPKGQRNVVRRNLRQFIKFGLVGASGVVVNLFVFTSVLLIWLSVAGHLASADDLLTAIRELVTKKETEGIPHAAAYVANLAGFVVSVLTNFALNRRWTFRSSGRVSKELSRFATISVAAYVGQFVIFGLLRSVLGLAPIPSQLIAILFVMPFNYVGNKLWSFR